MSKRFVIFKINGFSKMLNEIKIHGLKTGAHQADEEILRCDHRFSKN